MIIKLERYNEIRELLIEIGITGSQGHVCYDGSQRVSVTMAAVCMEVKEVGRTGYRGAYNWALSGG